MRSVTLDDKVYGIPEFYIVQANLDRRHRRCQPAGVHARADPDQGLGRARRHVGQALRAGRLEDQADRLRPQAAGLVPAVGDGQRRRHRRRGRRPAPRRPQGRRGPEVHRRPGEERRAGWTKFKAFRDSYDIFGEKNPLTVHSIAAFPMENWYVNVLRDSIPAGLKLAVHPVHRPPGPADEPARRLGLGDPQGREEPRGGVRVGQDDDLDRHLDEGGRGARAEGGAGQVLLHRPVHRQQAGRRPDPREVPQGRAGPRLQGRDRQLLRLARRGEGARPPPPPAPRSTPPGRARVSRALEGQDPRQALAQAQKEAQAAYEKVATDG